jgi:hypothetical protein
MKCLNLRYFVLPQTGNIDDRVNIRSVAVDECWDNFPFLISNEIIFNQPTESRNQFVIIFNLPLISTGRI